MNNGWQCPQCFAVMSPTYPTCFYCKPKEELREKISTPEIPPELAPSFLSETLKFCKHGIPTKFGRCIECKPYSLTTEHLACEHQWDTSNILLSNPQWDTSNILLSNPPKIRCKKCGETKTLEYI